MGISRKTNGTPDYTETQGHAPKLADGYLRMMVDLLLLVFSIQRSVICEMILIKYEQIG